jgi:hypothetical protein
MSCSANCTTVSIETGTERCSTVNQPPAREALGAVFKTGTAGRKPTPGAAKTGAVPALLPGQFHWLACEEHDESDGTNPLD